MKGKFILVLTLLVGSGYAFAQDTTSNQSTTDSRNGSTGSGDKSGNADGTRGTPNGSPPGTSASRMGGQTGDEAGTNTFDSMDANRHGYLTPSDVASNSQLNHRFKSCDTNHDGQLSRDEYNACMKKTSP